MLIDCHHHLWDLSKVEYPWLNARGVMRFFGDPTPIQQNYHVKDFQNDWAEIPISGSVHVQVGAGTRQEVAETEWLDYQARKTGFPSAIVAFADLSSDALEQTLDQHIAASKLVRGIRQIVNRHAAEDGKDAGATLLRKPGFTTGLKSLAKRGLSFDLQLTPPLLAAAAEVFSEAPDLPVALCHAGSPWDQDPASLKEWMAGLDAFSALPNAVCKLSGLGMFNPDWTRETLKPLVDGVLNSFGTERVMWGSNFPVDKLYRDYKSSFEVLWSLVPEGARDAVFGLNAARFYRLNLLGDSS